MDLDYFSEEENENVDLNITPEHIIEAANNVEGALLPPKSRERYERTYNEFKKWRRDHETGSTSERTFLAYFQHQANDKKPSTLWSYYSMLRSTLECNEKIDIAKYPKLIAFLKRKSDGYRAVKAKTFTEAEMHKFISEVQNSEWLVVKVSYRNIPKGTNFCLTL